MTAASHAGSPSFVVLRIGAARYALPAELVSELAPPVRLHQFPHGTPSLAGVILRRGRIVPVFDAGALLGAKPSSAQRFYLITRRRAAHAAEWTAIPVSGECELVSGDVQPPAQERPAYIAGSIAAGEQRAEVLDLGALLAAGFASGRDAGSGESHP